MGETRTYDRSRSMALARSPQVACAASSSLPSSNSPAAPYPPPAPSLLRTSALSSGGQVD
eukprot:749325-Hanusia_phi.AAC.3